ncbi:MAG: hypothetical protein ACTHM1_06670 [Solirubrobacteraceae bacterium]
MVRTPITSERDAFRLTVAGAAIIVAALLVGWLIDVWAGVALFVVAVLVAGTAYLRSPDPARRNALEEAEGESHFYRAPGRRHVLVIANDVLGGEELRRRLAGHDGDLEVDVLAPVLTSHIHFNVSDIDTETEHARARLRRSLEWMRSQGVHARGAIGDPNPITAIEDQLRSFGPDEVIVVTHPEQTWQERAELERLRGELDLPVQEVVAVGG